MKAFRHTYVARPNKYKIDLLDAKNNLNHWMWDVFPDLQHYVSICTKAATQLNTRSVRERGAVKHTAYTPANGLIKFFNVK